MEIEHKKELVALKSRRTAFVFVSGPLHSTALQQTEKRARNGQRGCRWNNCPGEKKKLGLRLAVVPQ